MEFKKGKKQVLYVWWLYLSLLTFFVLSFVFLFLKKLPLIFYLVTFILFSFFIYFFVYYLPAKLKAYSYYIGKDFLIIKSGVYWKISTTIFVENIQYLVKKTTLTERFFRLSSVRIKAIGGASQYIYGIDSDGADEVINTLLKKS